MRSGLYITAVNWHLKPDEVAYIVNDSGATALIVPAEQAPTAEAITGAGRGVKLRLAYGGPVAGFGSYEDTIAAAPDEPLADQPSGATCSTPRAPPAGPRASGRRCPTARSTEPGDALAALSSMFFGFNQDTRLPVPRADLPRRPAALVRLRPGARRHRRHDGAVRRRRRAGGHPGPPRHPRQFVPTMFVRMLQAARRTSGTATTCPACGSPIHAAAPCPVEVKQTDDRLVGPGPLRVLRRHRGHRA